MRLRKRDFPVTPVETAPVSGPSSGPVEPPEWTALSEQIAELQARQAAMHKEMLDAAHGPTLEQVQELLQAPVTPVGAGSEWVFDVKRGPYNEILNVYARRVPVGGARPH